MIPGVDLLLRAVVILTAAGAASFALRRAPASLRSGIWTLAFVSVLVLPILNRAMPAWRVGMLPSAAANVQLPVPSVPIPAPAPDVEPAPISRIATTPEPRFKTHIDPPRVIEAPSQASALFFVWFLVASFLVVRVTWSHLQARRLTRAAVKADSDGWRQLVDETRATLRISRKVTVLFTDAVALPAVVGVWRPSLLLPMDADEWNDDMRRIVLLHELAHVSRWDALRQLVERAVCAFYWCVPLTWLAARRSSAIREQACDDVVLGAGVEGPAYAARLIDLATRTCGAPAAALSMAQPSQMQSRVRRILNPSIHRRTLPIPVAFAFFVAASAVISAASTIVPVERATAAPRGTVISGDIADRSVSNSPSATPAPSSAGRAAKADLSAVDAAKTGFPAAASKAEAWAKAATQPQARPAATAPIQAAATALCGDTKNSSQSSIHEDNGSRRWTVKFSSPGCSVDFRVDGKIDFNDDFTDVATLSSGGVFTLDVTENGVRRQLDIKSRGGSLERTWKINGSERPYDAEARAWFGSFLVALDRRTAIGADARLPKLVRQGGVDAVLRETAFMSDYPRSVYFGKLPAATRLTPADVMHMIDQAAALGTSDFYAAEMLKSLSGLGRGDAGIHRSVMALVNKMKSDFYIAESIQYAIGKGPATSGDIDMLLQLIPRVSSDFYKTEVLSKITRAGALSPAQRASLAPAVSAMREDFYMAEFVKLLAGTGDLSVRDRSAVIDASARVSSDHYRVEVLKTIAADSSVTEPELQRMVDVSRSIKSDFYKSEALKMIARHRSATERTRQAVLDATAGMSSFYADEVRRTAGVR